MLIAASACALVGCWEEIHYQPPPAGSEPTAAAPSTADDEQAGNFGDDVATSLAGESETFPATKDEHASTDIAAMPPLDTPPLDTLPAPLGEPMAESELQFDPVPNTRLAAWSLGSTLSLAALANDRAASEDKVNGWFETARQQAAALGTTVADLPPRPAGDQVDREGTRAMDYLFAQGQVAGPHLASAFGDDHNALFEVALKSNILLVRYQPEAPISTLLAAAISQASERAALPQDLVQPVLALVEAKAPLKEVRDAVFDMHDRVGKYLSTAAP